MRLDALAEKWHDEAAKHALAGNPHRARYIEHMIGRLADPTFGCSRRKSVR